MLRFAGFFAGHDAGFIRARKYHESRTFKQVNYALGEAVDDIDILSLDSICRVENELERRMDIWESCARKAIDRLPETFGKGSMAGWVRVAGAVAWQLNRVFPQHRWTWPGWIYSRLRKVPSGNPWGWKDPRNGATLPLWREVFPEARILLIRKQMDERKSRSPSGVWFRDGENRRCAEYLQDPPAARQCEAVKAIDFERVTSGAEEFNELLRWLELPELSPRQFRGLLQVTGFESG
jgi:hypothetical protein